SADEDGEGEPGDMMEFFRRELRRRMEEQGRPMPENFGRPTEQGSGVIFRPDGYILTNRHVVENAAEVQVELQDGRKFKAEVRGADPHSDIAVLKVDATGLPAATLGDSARLRVGEFAIAIGAPFQLDYSVTFGHVSAKGRRVVSDMEMMDQDFIQTDASINPGNSGGPLVDVEGRVIGINTMIRGLNTGIGFAVPINLAREVADQIIAQGRIVRSWLGIGIENLQNLDAADRPGTPVPEGVVVMGINPGGPSDGSDLRRRDVIVSVDGAPIRTVADLKAQIRGKPPGQEVALGVFRGAEQLTLKVAPGERPAEMMASLRRGGGRPRPDPAPEVEAEAEPGKELAAKSAELGLLVRPVPPALVAGYGLEEDTGVLITRVRAGSPAAALGLQPGEVVTRVNRRTVRNVEEFETQLAAGDLKRGISLTLVGEEGRRFEVLKAE
ncbi:MAG: trypsin-like peptidase domain-containing protein, partial [Limisphaerales bacterium]